MRTYVIFDVNGMQHGTVKANGTTEAMNVFCGNGSQSFRDMVFAIETEAIDNFVNSIKKSNGMQVLHNDGIYYAKVKIGELTILRKGYCNFHFRLCDVEVTEQQAKEYLYSLDGSIHSLTTIDRMIMGS